ncbi:MAG TPA: amidohydrolase family protein [Gemmatimonadales bacterium]|nr:amidohydrolase family protein [Gemmatimonadales bacterium]
MTLGRGLLVAVILGGCRAPGAGVVALEGATVIDGSGGRPIQDAIILIRDGRIQAVARVNEIPVPRGARVIQLVGKTVIPGLIDAHAHVERWAAPRYLAWGVTTVRDLHNQTDTALALRQDFNLGAVLGPRMFTAGAMIDGAPATYPDATPAATSSEARRAVDQRAVAGTDYVKIYTRITPALLAPLVDEARSLRLPVAAHLGKIDALTAARAGVASIEHLSGMVQATSRQGPAVVRAHDRFLPGWTAEVKAWATLDSAGVAGLARALARSRVAVVPTLALYETLSRLDDRRLLQRAEMRDVPAAAGSVRDVAGLLRRSSWSPADFQAFRRARVRQDQFVREFRRAGGLLAAGSDAANQLLVPGASLHQELALLVRAGLTPLEALTTATRWAAQLLGADSLGMIAPGKVADLVVLNANPAGNIAATRDIAWVMLRGRMYRPDSLRQAWAR